jgi:hypothetical protein
MVREKMTKNIYNDEIIINQKRRRRRRRQNFSRHSDFGTFLSFNGGGMS